MPGKEAQMKMMARPGNNSRFNFEKRNDARLSGVLILLYPHAGDIHIPMIVRPDNSGPHSGQVAFPGGRMEESDIDITDTALRETWEEIGVPATRVQLLGRLTDLYIPVSNNLVSPVLGYTGSRPEFIPDQREVVKIIEAPLKHLLHPDTVKQRKLEAAGGIVVDAPYYDVENKTVWGATAMILCELLEIISVCL